MSSSPIHIIANIFPRAGKVDRVEELLTNLSKFVQANEPTCLRYQVHREINKETGVEELLMIESYPNEAAFAAHGETKEFKAFVDTVQKEDLFAAPFIIKFVKEVSGFPLRPLKL